MRSRPSPDDAALVAARLSAAVHGPAGWVPADLPDQEAGGRFDEPRDRWPGDAVGVRPDDALEPAEGEADVVSSWSQRAVTAPAGFAAVRSRLREVLPETVRGARVAPALAGAAALLVVALVAAAVVAVLVLRDRPREVAVPAVLRSGAPLPGGSATPSPTGEVVVSVAGAVPRPGLVRLPAGSRVDDAVRAAGGLLPGASYGTLNLARRVADGEQVLVGVPAAPAGAGASGGPDGPLDLNAATVEQLDALPGVGPVLADRIVSWRTENGRFASVDQLREVPGIGESKYATLKAKVRV